MIFKQNSTCKRWNQVPHSLDRQANLHLWQFESIHSFRKIFYFDLTNDRMKENEQQDSSLAEWAALYSPDRECVENRL